MIDKEELTMKLDSLSGILTALWEYSETGSGPALTNALRGTIDYLQAIRSTLES